MTYDTLKEDSTAEPMSFLRRLCFLLSLNGCVAYVAAFLWLIPCRHPSCLPSLEWTVHLNGGLTSGLEKWESPDSSPFVIFGYADDSGAKLSSLAISTGQLAWNISSHQIIHHIFCDFRKTKNFGNTVCLVAAYNFMGAINITNGEMLWNHTFPESSGEVISRLVASVRSAGLVFGMSDTRLHVIDIYRGEVLSTTPLPCSPLTGDPMLAKNDTLWVLGCECVELWTFRDELNLTKGGQVQFERLFSGDLSEDNIDLSCDVTKIGESSFAFSWANGVAMVTPDASSGTIWEQHFSSSVTSMTSGRFVGYNETQLALSLKNGSNTEIHILDTQRGQSKASIDFGQRSVMSMQVIPANNGANDAILADSISYGEEERLDSNATLPLRTYFLIQNTNGKLTYQKIASSRTYVSALFHSGDGAASLLLGSRNRDGSTDLRRHVIKDRSSSGKTCERTSSTTHS